MPSADREPFLSRTWRLFPGLLTALLLVNGCAGKPWRTELPEEELTHVAAELETLRLRDAACPADLDGDLALFYRTPLESQAIKGYLQFSMPNSYRLVVTNPLGQPLVMVAGNQVSYQAVNTLEKKYSAGSIRSFVLRRGIPDAFARGNWGDWLTARYSDNQAVIVSLNEDRTARGVWVGFSKKIGHGPAPKEYLLLDRQQNIILARMLEDGHGSTIAEITYSEWHTLGTCRQPLHIAITGLDYGVDISLRLSNLSFGNALKADDLPIPPGYIRQFLP